MVAAIVVEHDTYEDQTRCFAMYCSFYGMLMRHCIMLPLCLLLDESFCFFYVIRPRIFSFSTHHCMYI